MCSTNIGKRYTKERILNPLVDIDQLNESYNLIEIFLEYDKVSLIQNLEKYLTKIPDIERYHRKIMLKTIKPNEFILLINGYLAITDIYKLILQCNIKELCNLLFKNPEIFINSIQEILKKINLDNLENFEKIYQGNSKFYDFKKSFINQNINPEIDNIIENLKKDEDTLENICKHLNTFIKNNRGKLIENTICSKPRKKKNSNHGEYDEENFSNTYGMLNTTAVKGRILQNKSKEIDKNLCGNINIRIIRNQCYITSDIIFNLYHKYDESYQLLQKQYNKVYIDIIDNLSKYTFFNDIVKFISKIDYIKSCAKCAKKYKYKKPCIDNSTNQSFIDIKNMRHPIIERLINYEYITNDLKIGRNDKYPNNPYGLLLFSVNGVGKSSLMKALSLNLIMAQSGMYVPSDMIYYPYNRIITRLSGHDDLFTGDSSFSVEMKELRSILKNSDNKTLVVIDELCRGTENVSGTSLTIATIMELLKRKTTFILSTHLHNLIETTYIQEILNNDKNILQISHLTATFDENNHILVYDRKLKEGSGSTIYGIEVAKSLDIDIEFINQANTIRRNILGLDNILTSKKSKYNSNVYLNCCEFCGNKIDLHTHHIRPQSQAVDNFIEHIPKNATYNLIVLCKSCHLNLHKLDKQIITKQIPNGKIMQIV